MSAIEKLFPTSLQERSFQLKARQDAGTAAPNWEPPQFAECKKCGRRATRQVWVKSQYVCPNCGVHLAIGAYYRLSTVLDHGTFKELNPDIAPQDVLHFPDYKEKLAAATVKTGLKEAAVTATGKIGGVQTVVAVLDSRFFMGSMSTAVGEKITCAIEYAADKHLLLVIFSASGGARMQEGIFRLMQMIKEVLQQLEPLSGAQRGRQLLFGRMDAVIAAHLAVLCKMNRKALADQRYKKYRRIGEMRGR